MLNIHQVVNVIVTVVFTAPIAFMAIVWFKQNFMGDVV
jgi:hypothetical protein